MKVVFPASSIPVTTVTFVRLLRASILPLSVSVYTATKDVVVFGALKRLKVESSCFSGKSSYACLV
jgi:hypothetical protein